MANAEASSDSDLIQDHESEHLDRKRAWPTNRVSLLHDILCLANSAADQDRYLVFGIANDRTVVGVEEGEHRMSSADIQDFLRQQDLNRLPKVEVEERMLDGHTIDVLRIRDRECKPFFLTKDKSSRGETIRNGVIYTRIGDTNVPLKESAPEEMVEAMWRERFGLDQPALARLHRLLDEPDNWLDPDGLAPLYHSAHPELTIRRGETIVRRYSEPWSESFPDPHARSYEVTLLCSGTVIASLVFVSCDGGRYQVPVPDRDTRGLYIERNSMGWKTSRVLNRRGTAMLRVGSLEDCGIEFR